MECCAVGSGRTLPGAAAKAEAAQWSSAVISLQLYRAPPSCAQGNIAGVFWSRELFPNNSGGLIAQQTSWWIFKRAKRIYVRSKVFP